MTLPKNNALWHLKENMTVFRQGLKDGIPIGLGYLAVSFSLGIAAKTAGLTPIQGFVVSLLCMASAGEYVGFLSIAAGAAYVEISIATLIANARYLLMSTAMSQRMESKLSIKHRLLMAFGITDEVFAVSYAQPFLITPAFMYGIILVSFVGWVLGTVLGASAGHFLPEEIISAMGIALYGMFLAIIIPPAKKEKSVLFVISLTAAISMVFYYLLPMVTSGFSVIISAVAASLIAAWLFPVKEDAP